MTKLGINIDHVATLRQARREEDPNPIEAAKICEQAGADSIVCHLREDRRHINEHDVKALKKAIKIPLNLEMSLNKEIVAIAASIKPTQVTLVPEKRIEITTEGGLDVIRHYRKIKQVTETLNKKKIAVSIFIDPIKEQITKAKETGATIIELHTGCFDLAKTKKQQLAELRKIKEAAQFAHHLGLIVSAGHGLKYHNTKTIAEIPEIIELNIGHSIISHAVFVGLKNAVKEMKKIVRSA